MSKTPGTLCQGNHCNQSLPRLQGISERKDFHFAPGRYILRAHVLICLYFFFTLFRNIRGRCSCRQGNRWVDCRCYILFPTYLLNRPSDLHFLSWNSKNLALHSFCFLDINWNNSNICFNPFSVQKCLVIWSLFFFLPLLRLRGWALLTNDFFRFM